MRRAGGKPAGTSHPHRHRYQDRLLIGSEIEQEHAQDFKLQWHNCANKINRRIMMVPRKQVHRCFLLFLLYMNAYFKNIREIGLCKITNTQINIYLCVCVCLCMLCTLYLYTDQAETDLIPFDVWSEFLVSCCSLLHWQHSAVGLQRDPRPPPNTLPHLFIKLNSQLSK